MKRLNSKLKSNEEDSISQTHKDNYTTSESSKFPAKTKKLESCVDQEQNKIEEAIPSVNIKTGKWTKDEKMIFLEGFRTFGPSWSAIAKLLKTRSCGQIRAHAQQLFQKQRKNSQRHSQQSYTGVCEKRLLVQENRRETSMDKSDSFPHETSGLTSQSRAFSFSDIMPQAIAEQKIDDNDPFNSLSLLKQSIDYSSIHSLEILAPLEAPSLFGSGERNFFEITSRRQLLPILPENRDRINREERTKP